MTVTAYGENFECAKAVKGSDYIQLFDGVGECIAMFSGIADFSGYAISDGDWTVTTLEEVKAAKIANSKTQLADYLAAHPLTYSDDKQYSITAEKQSLLTSALARYQIATAAGVDAPLKWNATGEECTVWAYDDLAALALAIAAYVEPLVAQQQAAEVAINACTTVVQTEAITVAYGS